MFLIRDAQLRELNKIPLNIFTKKVEKFILENVDAETTNKLNLSTYLIEQFNRANAKGLKTEREIINYILENIS